MAGSEETEDREELPRGILQPGRLTTTADPEMRERAKRIIRQHKEEESRDRSDER